MTRVAWQSKKSQIVKATPGVTRKKFVYNLSRASFEKDWGNDYTRPGFGARFLAALFNLMPKIGPFRALKFRPLTPDTERLFMQSFNATVDRYRRLAQESDGSIQLPNANLDTGKPTAEGAYDLADKTYGKLTEKLMADKFSHLTPEIRTDILKFYSTTAPPSLSQALEQLRAAQPSILGKEKAN